MFWDRLPNIVKKMILEAIAAEYPDKLSLLSSVCRAWKFVLDRDKVKDITIVNTPQNLLTFRSAFEMNPDRQKLVRSIHVVIRIPGKDAHPNLGGRDPNFVASLSLFLGALSRWEQMLRYKGPLGGVRLEVEIDYHVAYPRLVRDEDIDVPFNFFAPVEYWEDGIEEQMYIDMSYNYNNDNRLAMNSLGSYGLPVVRYITEISILPFNNCSISRRTLFALFSSLPMLNRVEQRPLPKYGRELTVANGNGHFARYSAYNPPSLWPHHVRQAIIHEYEDTRMKRACTNRTDLGYILALMLNDTGCPLEKLSVAHCIDARDFLFWASFPLDAPGVGIWDRLRKLAITSTILTQSPSHAMLPITLANALMTTAAEAVRVRMPNIEVFELWEFCYRGNVLRFEVKDGKGILSFRGHWVTFEFSRQTELAWEGVAIERGLEFETAMLEVRPKPTGPRDLEWEEFNVVANQYI